MSRTPVAYDKVSDEVLKQIAFGNGHTYSHEGRAMARELLEFREARDAASKASGISPWSPYGGTP